MIGLTDLGRMFGFSTNRAAFNASFGTGENGEGSKHENVLWGTNGMVSRTLLIVTLRCCILISKLCYANISKKLHCCKIRDILQRQVIVFQRLIRPIISVCRHLV